MSETTFRLVMPPRLNEPGTFINAVTYAASRRVAEVEAAHPLPPGWRYRVDAREETEGGAWMLHLDLTPEPIPVPVVYDD